ncbi:excinuclease ABC subunit UvrC [Gryllotalpicola sp.]|uniref:excinuclease ABC subunit UvrC n=1 Tax=Gryllotalpicola sp. TaxID=1932787 RepID=UPI00263735A1|nr:excinuclease ABC subunit UvrC [Gryllotalpicola sp.]
MADTVSWRPRTGEIPTLPGVYRFRDPSGRVLYVGKAKNLRARLSNYFQPLRSLHERTRRMVTTAASVEWTVVASEFEALQLEFTWIKEFDPPFNVVFKDDKSYPYLAVTMGEEVPRVFATRNRGIKGARYFGPYMRAWAVRETVDLMLKAIPMRSCTDGVYDRAERTGRPCLLADIGKCAAPCVGRISKTGHRELADDFVSFLSGNDQSYLRELTKRMQDASAAQNYEQAARYRDQIQALSSVLERSSVVFADNVDADVFGLAEDELAAAVHQFIVRGGRIRGVRNWVVDTELDVTLGELVESVLESAYDGVFTPPREILVPELPDGAAALEEWLTLRRAAGDGSGRRTALTGRVTLRVPQRGDKAKLAATAALNAKGALALYKTRRSADFTARSQALGDIQEALGMAVAPLRIECYDVSHLSGTNVVASMVVFEDALPRKDRYRRFSIPGTTDDTDSLYQVLTRRLSYLKDPEGMAKGQKFAYPPQLLLVDGGQPQVAAARRALEESGVEGIQLAGIAKRLEELWLPDSDFPVILPRNSDALFLIQRVRDEAHRFAVAFQRQKRRRDIGSVLAEVPGLGPARVKELLTRFGSVKRLKEASVDEIAATRGIGATTAQTVFDRLHDDAESGEAADAPSQNSEAAR